MPRAQHQADNFARPARFALPDMLNAEHKRIVVVPAASYYQPLVVRGQTHNKAAEQVQWAVAAHYSALQVAHIVAAADNRQAQSL